MTSSRCECVSVWKPLVFEVEDALPAYLPDVETDRTTDVFETAIFTFIAPTLFKFCHECFSQ